jgi:hypothetical protein
MSLNATTKRHPLFRKHGQVENMAIPEAEATLPLLVSAFSPCLTNGFCPCLPDGSTKPTNHHPDLIAKRFGEIKIAYREGGYSLCHVLD